MISSDLTRTQWIGSKISYFTDVLCVWAYVSQVRIDELKANFEDAVELDCRYFQEMSRSLLNIAKRPLPRLTLRGVGLTSKDAVS